MWSVGHSTHALPEFLGLLEAHQLVTAGWEVRHIAPDGRTSAHELTDFARVVDGGLVYPATNEQLGLL